MDPTPLAELLRNLDPCLHDGAFAFCACSKRDVPSWLEPVAVFHEEEGCSLIVAESAAQRANLPIVFRAAWITLNVHSELDALGLTAAVSTALATAGIPCNMVAAVRHDHLFVPAAMASRAMGLLRDLQGSAGVRA